MSKHYFPAERNKNGDVIPQFGKAQQMGYSNRAQYRQETRELAKKKKNASGFPMGAMSFPPIPPPYVTRRRKLKYWQKAA